MIDMKTLDLIVVTNFSLRSYEWGNHFDWPFRCDGSVFYSIWYATIIMAVPKIRRIQQVRKIVIVTAPPFI